MDTLANTLIYAIAYIEMREEASDISLDNDVNALESIAYYLSQATDQELDAMATAANSALRAELSTELPRPKFVNFYGHFMENLLDGWVCNRRE
jgi:hypothetical protein